MFPVTSRYNGIEIASLAVSPNRTVPYLRRRFVPPPGNGGLLAEPIIMQGDRLDNITARYLGDPEQFWRVCDANNAMRPDELTETIGRQLRITLPQGIPG